MVPEPQATLRNCDGSPLNVPPWDEGDGPSERALSRATWAFVVLGVVLRLLRYASNQPLWGDEGYLGASLIDRGFLDQLRPLEYYQVAPLFFLWVELAVVQLLGFAEWTLRLFPVFCGMASVVVFAHVARRTLAGVPRLIAVGIFSGSFYLIRYATEVKPYATDLLVTLVLIALAVEWWRDRGATRWLWALAASMPLALGFSYPAVYVAGGLSLALLMPVWRSDRRRNRLAYLALNLSLAASFLTLYALVIRGQTASAGPGMHNYWAEAFPPSIARPLALVLWFLETHTSRMFAYPAGEAHGGSALTTALVVIGALALWKRGRRTLLVLLLSPFPLALLGAAMGRYPYGGSSRVMQHVAPSICLLAGLGAARLVGMIPRPERRRRALRFTGATLAGIGVISIAADLARPYKFAEDEQSRQFARRFWVDQARDAELACVKRDLGDHHRRLSLGNRPIGRLPVQPDDLFAPPSPRARGDAGPRLGRPPAAMCALQRGPRPSRLRRLAGKHAGTLPAPGRDDVRAGPALHRRRARVRGTVRHLRVRSPGR